MFNFTKMKMKKTSLLGVFFLSVMLMFTSCLGDGSNVSSGTVIGVVRFDTETFRNVLDVSEYQSLYSIAFKDMNEGDCCTVYYELDMDDPENQSEKLQLNKYYTIKVLNKASISKYNISNSLTDTTKLLTNEISIDNPIYGNSNFYIKGNLFLVHEFDEPTDQKSLWNISYDPKNMVAGEGKDKVYNVYIRATNTGTQSTKLTYQTNAYNMGYYLKQIANQEKNLNNESFKLNFNYVSEIKDSIFVWKANTLDVLVELILPSENQN